MSRTPPLFLAYLSHFEQSLMFSGWEHHCSHEHNFVSPFVCELLSSKFVPDAYALHAICYPATSPAGDDVSSPSFQVLQLLYLHHKEANLTSLKAQHHLTPNLFRFPSVCSWKLRTLLQRFRFSKYLSAPNSELHNGIFFYNHFVSRQITCLYYYSVLAGPL